MNRRPRPTSSADLFEGAAPRRSGRAALTVTELANELKHAAETATGQVWVKGEVMGLKEYGGGHWYFSLRDPESQLRCVMWRTYTQRLKVAPPEGTEVYLLATPTVWPQRGELRLTAVAMLPTAGVGTQQLAFERTRELLERDGLLDPARKRPLPAFPRTVAVVTSADGVVMHDIVTVARRRWPSVRLILVPAKVQGDDAVDELVAALGVAAGLAGVEVVVVARGGGARDDLLAFNTEPVCRAVAATPMPTVSAVGHETDVTLVDLVADVRAPTPSAAAELVVPDRRATARQVASLASRLAQGLSRRTTLTNERLARLSDRATAALKTNLIARRQTFERLAAGLEALSPLAVLGRGYGIAQLADGTVIRRPSQVAPGDPFSVRVAEGTIQARGE